MTTTRARARDRDEKLWLINERSDGLLARIRAAVKRIVQDEPLYSSAALPRERVTEIFHQRAERANEAVFTVLDAVAGALWIVSAPCGGEAIVAADDEEAARGIAEKLWNGARELPGEDGESYICAFEMDARRVPLVIGAAIHGESHWFGDEKTVRRRVAAALRPYLSGEDERFLNSPYVRHRLDALGLTLIKRASLPPELGGGGKAGA